MKVHNNLLSAGVSGIVTLKVSLCCIVPESGSLVRNPSITSIWNLCQRLNEI